MLDWDHQLDLIQEHSQDATGAVNASKVCILSLEDGTILNKLDQDNTFAITEDEAKVIAHAFKIKDFTAFKNDGVVIEDTKYNFMNSEDDCIVLAKKRYLGDLSIQSTATKVIIAFTQEGYHQTNTNIALKNIVKHFGNIGL